MQIAKRGGTGAEIVETDEVSGVAQSLDKGAGAIEIVDLGGFGDLEDQPGADGIEFLQ